MASKITIETTTGSIGPKDPAELTLEDVLALRRLPGNLFQAYVGDGTGRARPIPVDTALAELPPGGEAALRCIMNPNFSEFMEIITTRHRRAGAVTTLSEVEFGVEGCEKIVYELDPATARELVGNRVRNFVGEHCDEQRVLVGVSGGGDSNALIGPLATALAGSGRELVAYTLVCEPIWPEASAARASQLCYRHDVRHIVLDGTDVAELLGMRSDVPTLYAAFLDRYGSATSHFLATFLISAVARRLCARYDTHEYSLGFNREDVLAELLFSIINGRHPLEYPVRRFGGYRLLMPVWEVPKTVLDECYPDYSLANYEHRISTTPQRGLIYFLAHSIEGAYPNLGLSLMTGMRALFDGQWPVLQRDEAFDAYPEGLASEAELADARTFLSRHFRGSDSEG